MEMADGGSGSDQLSDGTRDISVSANTESRSHTQLKCFIEGDVYTALQCHFLMQGKGRRPDLPSLEKLTNGLLLQLFFLKEEKKTTYKELRTWLNKLLPATSTVSDSRIYHCINSLLDSCTHLPEVELTTCLEAEFNFCELPQVLRIQGVTNIEPELYNLAPIEDICNEIVVTLSHIASREGRPASFIRKWLVKLSLACARLTDDRLRNHVSKCLTTYKKLSKRKKVDEIERFMNSLFINKSEVQLQQPLSVNSCTKIQKDKEVERQVKEGKCLNCDQMGEALKKKDDQLEEKDNQIMVKDNQLKEKEQLIRELEQTLADSERDKTVIKKRLKSLDTELNEIKQHKLYYKRNMALNGENVKLNATVKELNYQLDCTTTKVTENKKMQQCLKRKVKSEQTLKSKYKKETKDLKEEKETMMYALNEVKEVQQSFPIKENHHNLYSNHIRQLYMALQGQANVASTQATKVVRLVAKHLFNKDFKLHELPCPRTCLNFMYEGNHISKQQIAEMLLNSNHFTYGSDGTGREKQHFLEHHVILENGTTLSLGFSEVPNDKADTLLQKSLDLFDELSDIYCDVDNSADRTKIFSTILSKLRCLMSDRAANMKLFNKRMLQFKKDLLGQDAAIEFLHCNAHFLIAISDVAEKASKSVENTLGRLGRDKNSAFHRFASSGETAACRVIRLTANIFGPRGDEKNGCRQEWLAHCDASGVVSSFTSYRTNRFNNLFENAIALLQHKDESLLFLKDYVSHSNQLLHSISLDLQDKDIMSIVTGIALFASVMTCPYWKLMNSSTPYGQFPRHVKSMKTALEKWFTEEFDVSNLQDETPVFGEEYHHHSQVAFTFFSTQCDKELTTSTFKAICRNSCDVLNRQLCDFLEDGVYGGDLPSEIQELLDTCPLTNLIGERLFGDLDYDMTKRRTASTFLRSVISMMKHNNTSAYLNTKSPNELNAIMSSGRKQGKKLKEKHKEAQRQAKELLKAKLIENEHLKREKELREIEKRAHIMTEIVALGGICHTKHDLDLLMEKPERMKNLKTQIRFYKYYLNAPALRLSGNFQTLYTDLCNHLNPGVDEVLEECDSLSLRDDEDEEVLGGD